MNGGINLSELDGWWAEAYTPEVGWALGDGLEHGDDPAWDAVEAGELYRILEEEVVPEFFPSDAAAFRDPGLNACGKAWRSLLAIFSQPGGTGIHRAALPSGCSRLCGSQCR